MAHSKADLFVFGSSTKSDGKLASLDEYISRMKPGQKDIFYISRMSNRCIIVLKKFTTVPSVEAGIGIVKDKC